MVDRSRSPVGHVSTDEIARLVIQREQARAGKDFAGADAIRDKLGAIGVQLFDKSHEWKAADGRLGRIPGFREIEEGHVEGLGGNGPQDDWNGVADGSDSHIKHLVREREKARAAKDFVTSDSIREQLKMMSVDCLDKEKIWRSSTGSCGIIIGHKHGGVSDMEITTLVQQREKARESSDWATADMVRDELKQVGVQIFDKEKTWRSSDGRSGPVPRWDARLPGDVVMQPTAAPVMMRAQQQMQRSVVIPHNVGVQASLQDQIIEAALAASTTPETAAHTLAVLRSLLQQQHQAMPARAPMAAPARAPMQAVQHRAPSGVNSPPEARDAMSFIATCQANGGIAQAQDADIEWLVMVREKCRLAKDFSSADGLRNGLKALGVEMYEKEKKWVVASDGRQGAIPLWQEFDTAL